MLTHEIYKYAKEHNIPMKDGETYRAIHERILENNTTLHSVDELKKYGEELLDKLLKEFGFKATRVFAYYPLISTKAYHGFEEVYLYKNIHEAMGCVAQAFCKLNKINESLDKQILQHEFENAYRDRFGFFKLMYGESSSELVHFMHLLRKHSFDNKYITLLEDDIKCSLIRVGDKYFHTLDLTERDNILLLYEVCGISYGFPEYRFDVFQEYDGYGNVVSCVSKDFIINDLNHLREEVVE